MKRTYKKSPFFVNDKIRKIEKRIKIAMIFLMTIDFIFKVKNIDLFSSIFGFLNIGLTLYDSKEFNFLSIGDEVYIISK